MALTTRVGLTLAAAGIRKRMVTCCRDALGTGFGLARRNLGVPGTCGGRAGARLAIVTTTVLDREMFSEAEAARLLRVPQSTLHYWLDGGSRGGRTYKPI